MLPVQLQVPLVHDIYLLVQQVSMSLRVGTHGLPDSSGSPHMG